jgi:ribosomal protein S12 methylthiotransferase accessory factor YcaO
VLDLTTDLGVPTFVAAAIHGSDPAVEPVLGSGTHFDPSIALTCAVGEVAQGWKSEPNMFRADEFFLASGGRHFSQAAFLQPHPDTRPRSAESYQDCSGDDFLGDVLSCVALLQSHDMETLVADLTRADVPLKAVRVCVAGARPVLPAFASGRLFDVLVALGWVDHRLAEEELNPVPFYQTIRRA